jgi:hypothetical protein
MEVLNLRIKLPSQELQQMSDGDLAAYAVMNSFIGGKGVARFKIAALQVNGATAIASLSLDAEEPSLVLQFFKEDGVWRVDWRTAMYGGTPLDAIVPGNEAAREELVQELLSPRGGNPVGPSIWQPPLQRP